MPVQKQETAIKMRPYHLGVALSGGGARGFAHAGALKAIEQTGYYSRSKCRLNSRCALCGWYAPGKHA